MGWFIVASFGLVRTVSPSTSLRTVSLSNGLPTHIDMIFGLY
jgi:hypothetical protein